jgi:signal transduction histidine kinase
MPHLSLRRVLPVIALAVFGAMAVTLWQNQNKQERELMLRHAETSAEQLRIRIEGLMNARVASLKLMADRYVERQPFDFSEGRFYGFAEVLFRYYQGFAEIHWINLDGSVRWIYPKEDGTNLEGGTLSKHPDPGCQAALIEAGESRKDAVTPCLLHEGGRLGFHVIVPLVADDKVHGFLDGIFLIPELMEFCIPPGIKEDFAVKLYDNKRLIYTSGSAGGADRGMESIHARREIDFAGVHWDVELQPSGDYYANASSRHRDVLIFGLALSATLSLLLYFLLRRMELYRESRDQALREVTERQRVEAVLRDNEQRLEALLAELAAKNAEMESFVYTVSHDLKTPIVTIEGFVGALREDFADQLPEAGDQYLRYMSEAARKMELLINDLLNLSRIGRLVEAKVEFSLFELVQESLDSLRPLIEARGIEIHVQSDLPVVFGERRRIGQVIDNLLSNAVKYIGKDNPSPRIEIGCLEQHGRPLCFVRDNGIGIDRRYYDKIFQIFERLPAAKQVGDGTGIGLTIVKRIVEWHGGKVWLESELGRGTAFFFTLPGPGGDAEQSATRDA